MENFKNKPLQMKIIMKFLENKLLGFREKTSVQLSFLPLSLKPKIDVITAGIYPLTEILLKILTSFYMNHFPLGPIFLICTVCLTQYFNSKWQLCCSCVKIVNFFSILTKIYQPCNFLL